MHAANIGVDSDPLYFGQVSPHRRKIKQVKDLRSRQNMTAIGQQSSCNRRLASSQHSGYNLQCFASAAEQRPLTSLESQAASRICPTSSRWTSMRGLQTSHANTVPLNHAQTRVSLTRFQTANPIPILPVRLLSSSTKPPDPIAWRSLECLRFCF
jgi:hypothetical protein